MIENELRENVIEGLEMSYTYSNIDEGNTLVPQQLVLDALALLKAQEPVEPYTERDGRTTFFLCGGCNKPLCIAKESYKPKHCPECGRAVKWE